MCQFGSTEDETYKSFLRSVKRMLQEDVKNELFLVPQCLSHNFTGRDEIRRRLRNCLISNRFIPSRTQQRFVLHGLRGSGKTQICLKFAQEHREA
jgi:signal recognition particle GTPase